MMTPEQQTRIDEITARCTMSHEQSIHTLEDRQNLVNDIVWLIQLLEMKDTQLDMLTAPEHIRALVRTFGTLTQTRKALVLELMREMKEVRQ